MHQGRLTMGRALDLAGGLGENAAILALAGWRTVCADLSDVAVARARGRARELKADLHVVQAEARRLPFRGPFETIVVARFLERAIAPELLRLLAPGGTLFCEQAAAGLPADWSAGPGDFARLFPSLEILLDRTEDGSSVFIGRKPARP
jgi:SAM-dependent methyltransferase